MRIYLNILPEEYKKKLRRKKIAFRLWVQVVSIFSLIVFFCTALVGIVLGMDYYDQFFLGTSTDIPQEGNIAEVRTYDELFQEKNVEARLARALLTDQKRYVGVFHDLAELRLDGVYITEISLEKNMGDMEGIGKTRDGVLEFQRRIEDHECFSSVEVPLEDLVQKENVTFVASFIVEEKCLNFSSEE